MFDLSQHYPLKSNSFYSVLILFRFVNLFWYFSLGFTLFIILLLFFLACLVKMSYSMQSRWPSIILNDARSPTSDTGLLNTSLIVLNNSDNNGNDSKSDTIITATRISDQQPARRDYVPWSKRETDALVEWLRLDDNFAVLRRSTTKMLPCLAQHLNQTVSGCHKTAKQCDHKIRNLKKVHKKMHQKLSVLGLTQYDLAPEELKQEIIDQFPYFKEFDQLVFAENSQSVPSRANIIGDCRSQTLSNQLSLLPLSNKGYSHSPSASIDEYQKEILDYSAEAISDSKVFSDDTDSRKRFNVDQAFLTSRKRLASMDEYDQTFDFLSHEKFSNSQQKQPYKPDSTPLEHSIANTDAALSNNSNQTVSPKWLNKDEITEKTGVLLSASQIGNSSKEVKPALGCPFHNQTQTLSRQPEPKQSPSSLNSTNNQVCQKSESTSAEITARPYFHLPKIESLIQTSQAAQQQPTIPTTPQVQPLNYLQHQPQQQLSTHVRQRPNKRMRSSSFPAFSSIAGMPISMCPVVSGATGTSVPSGCPVQRGEISLPMSTIAAAVSTSSNPTKNSSNGGSRKPLRNITSPSEPLSKVEYAVDSAKSPYSLTDPLTPQDTSSNEEAMHTTLLSILKIMSEDKPAHITVPSDTSKQSSSSLPSPPPLEIDLARETALLLAQHIKSSLAKRDAANKQALQLQQLRSQIEREMTRAELLYKNGQRLRADRIMDKIDELENELHAVYAKPANDV